MPLNSTDRDDVSSRITPHIGLLPGAPRGDYQASLRLLARYDPSRSSGAPVRVRRSRHPHRDAAVASQDQAGEDRACRGVQTRLVDLGRMARGLRRPPDHDQHGPGGVGRRATGHHGICSSSVGYERLRTVASVTGCRERPAMPRSRHPLGAGGSKCDDRHGARVLRKMPVQSNITHRSRPATRQWRRPGRRAGATA